MAPSRFYSLRGRPNPGSSSSAASSVSVSLPSRHIPSASADDSISQFVAFRYEETIQAELPIPIPPPRNPLRNARSRPRPATITTTTNDVSIAGKSNLAHAIPPAPAPAPAKATQHQQSQHITVPPPLPLTRPLPLPSHLAPGKQQQQQQQPHDEHPTFRFKNPKDLSHQRQSQDSSQHSPSTSSTTCADWKRDSALGTLSSASTTAPDDDYKDDAYVKLDQEDPPSCKYSTQDGSALPTRPRPRASTATSTVASTFNSTSSASAHRHIQLYNPKNAPNAPRISCQSRWSLTDSEVSDSKSFKEKSSTRRLIRGLSLRVAPSMKRSKKPAALPAETAHSSASAAAATTAMPPPPSTPTSAAAAAPHDQIPESHHPLQGSPAPHSSSQPNLSDPSCQEIVHHDSQFPNPNHPGPLSPESLTTFPPSAFAPTINTNIPQGSLDDLDDFSFSNRGSIYFGATRAISASKPSLNPEFMDKFNEPRAAPRAPTSPVDGASDLRPHTADSKRPRTRQSRDVAMPEIRVMSEDTERESQKVRSLYESTDLVHWEDGAPGRRSSELLEPPAEVPSDGESNIAYGFPSVFRFAQCFSLP